MDDDDEVMTVPTRKLTLLDVCIVTLDSFTSFVDDVNQLLCAHSNWKIQRRMFTEQARLDIEAIVGNE